MELSSIFLFTYNRLIHTQKVFEALLQNEYASVSDLIIYSDEGKDEKIKHEVLLVREYLKSIPKKGLTPPGDLWMKSILSSHGDYLTDGDLKY